ncbi:Putative tRNA A58 N-methyltranspherases [Komagataella phaffii CBS 7435]|uniref:tRNA (adenine(58)-N(1))-methyltransferase catalytic subunit TRM61 n=1 Tax=Komagataella phaffii (strain ATCC 76273 / CBS 7435 / CECT 11047 / NRRL Y-11430 / Wegner 21-1) TaxID=981350 RepID=F2QRU4_KOMPC|nr:GQ67_00916T0 [Komagataella phaffii]AOA67198.1 GQ68_00473T0 [Komagataella phaffii GS115]CAH2447962.1 Putative tRNA A58 N-methyltranspherases [Komagataella phaffii CBS 7435]CCA38122.1 Putative tRNA A58 N-methyltranspherases [Komagataella phaffii CBS 7435]
MIRLGSEVMNNTNTSVLPDKVRDNHYLSSSPDASIYNASITILGPLKRSSHLRMFARKYSVFQVGDIAILRQVTRPDKVWLSKPLKPGNFQGVKSGSISHDDIIGTRSRCKVFETSKGQFKFMCYKPSLEEYVNLTKRDAQPIYPFNAATIVQLADLNVDYPELERKQNGEYCLKDEPLQFLECGTGHGSLTLAIAKSIHSGKLLQEFERARVFTATRSGSP